jgi:hypothetical protein
LLEIGGFCNHRDVKLWRLCLVISLTDLEFALDGVNTSHCLFVGSLVSRRSATLVRHLVAGLVMAENSSCYFGAKARYRERIGHS